MAAAVIPASAPAAMALNGAQFGNASLYVGDLEANVNEIQLYELFSQVGLVVSVRVCRDLTRRSSLGYAYVNFSNAQDAANAMEHLNFTLLNGKAIRIMFSHRDPSIRKSGYANVFIKNLDKSIDSKALHDTFLAFGPVLSTKVAVDFNGQSKGYGYVQFDNEESAQNAIKQLNGMLLNDKKVYVGIFVRRQERAQTNGSLKFTNVYVKNFPETYTDEDVKNLFSTYGTITSAVVMKDTNGNSRCFGFVNFESPDSAAAAVEKLNGITVNDDKVLYIGRAQIKSEREAELKAKFEQERISKYAKLQAANLYLKNLGNKIDDEKLKEIFSEFGTITSCKVMTDMHGHSKGFGFVAFSTPEEANNAMNEMNGKMIGRKPLYVAVAQRKEERTALLQTQFSQIQTPNGITPLSTGISGYHSGTPRLAPQQVYYGQVTADLLPPQPAGYDFQQQLWPGMPQPAGYGFQQQFLPGIPQPVGYGFQQQLPGVGPGVTPNFITPYHHLHSPSGRRGVWRGENFQRTQQNQMLHRNRNRNSNERFRDRNMESNRNGMDGSETATAPDPADNQPCGALSNTLASPLGSESPENQPLPKTKVTGMSLEDQSEVSHLNESPEDLKVTGMSLEDQSEVSHLIESPEDLKIKVSEAI